MGFMIEIRKNMGCSTVTTLSTQNIWGLTMPIPEHMGFRIGVIAQDLQTLLLLRE
jgi:hypothetical protein